MGVAAPQVVRGLVPRPLHIEIACTRPDAVCPIPVSEYRGTGHSWAYQAPEQKKAGTQAT